MKKKLKKLIIISISIVLFIVLAIIFIPDKNIIIKTDRITFKTEQEFVDTSKYIFIAKVTKKEKPKIGYYYLFIILENSGEKDFLLETDYQKIILKNYLEDKPLTNQTKENQEIINKYKNLIKI